jgi:hypothetical protein
MGAVSFTTRVLNRRRHQLYFDKFHSRTVFLALVRWVLKKKQKNRHTKKGHQKKTKKKNGVRA